MDFRKLRALQIDNKIRINNQIFKICSKQVAREAIEHFLTAEETELEYVLSVPDEKDDIEKLMFYKVFRHGSDVQFLPVGFKKTIELLE